MTKPSLADHLNAFATLKKAPLAQRGDRHYITSSAVERHQNPTAAPPEP